MRFKSSLLVRGINSSCRCLFIILASDIETTLGKLPMGNVSMKRVKNNHKAQGRYVDEKGNSIWFEITGANTSEVMNQFHAFDPRSNASFTPMALSHSDGTQFVACPQKTKVSLAPPR